MWVFTKNGLHKYPGVHGYWQKSAGRVTLQTLPRQQYILAAEVSFYCKSNNWLI